ncbi:hypothetical protein HanRHA438_Chr15g0691901 [Helianthus annuus]|nr:hypothetical protein HanRHA438_Chr15g0691901 [Helianthus annuus]
MFTANLIIKHNSFYVICFKLIKIKNNIICQRTNMTKLLYYFFTMKHKKYLLNINRQSTNKNQKTTNKYLLNRDSADV